MPASHAATAWSGLVHIAWASGTDARRTVLDRLLRDAGSPGDAVTHECPRCGSAAHGPLRTSSGTTVLSLSHAGDLTAGAIARADAAASVGIDIEADRGSAPLTELAALFAPREPPTLREWTMIEAVVKADGRGLRIAPADIRFEGSLARIAGRSPIEVAEIEAPSGYVISVAIDPVRPSRRGRGSDR
ncbi:hypothetical protein RS84_00709 [Microbacterium hydrocarbonoxydans]|uniref:4'-phosphopantetheinyl transferase n=1 Tax=Microbacterium hydrocarbonoxydans TaxID=273678 RepID=A0A0M2HXC2_9MICO|nr:hypothetical protein [Microbacterium hydrocarbonoxydans]KJL49079.1 hypothetical protein RS84_00709 [Microbacterium hydrocarbonoxydans]